MHHHIPFSMGLTQHSVYVHCTINVLQMTTRPVEFSSEFQRAEPLQGWGLTKYVIGMQNSKKGTCGALPNKCKDFFNDAIK